VKGEPLRKEGAGNKGKNWPGAAGKGLGVKNGGLVLPAVRGHLETFVKNRGGYQGQKKHRKAWAAQTKN